ncbi:MAG TPA: hypothetical protein VFZ77_20895 [Acidimicrobiales bacterium]
MDMHVRVELGRDGPVVVKAAAGGGADRLRRERERLARASHPGVVALAGLPGAGDHDGGEHDGAQAVLCTVYAGESLSGWAGPAAAVAGLGAAVASTLADLHEAGIVHGRLDESHVLVADDGRPRLCGMVGADGATPADDVAALGALLGTLLRRVDERPRGGRGRRGAARTARRALGRVVEQATDHVPTRRPTARALGDAILAAVPGAMLPSTAAAGRDAATGGSRSGRRPARGSGHISSPDALERIWSCADLPSEDERWAAALGSGPPDLPAPAGPPASGDSGRATRTGRDGSPGDDGDLPPSADGDSGPAPGPDDHTVVDPAPWPDDHTVGDPLPWPDADAADDPLPRPDDHTVGDPLPRPHDHTVGDPLPWPDGDTANDPLPRPDGEAGPSQGEDHGDDDADRDGDRTRDHVPAGGRSPARRPAPGGARERPARRRSRRLAVAVTGLALLGLAAVAATSLGPGGGPGTPRSRPAATTPGTGCAAVPPPAADVDGDGCPERLAVDGATVDAGVARWSLGEPGDHVALGDWDCDGQASAALVRPATGDVFVFPGWAEEGDPLTVASAQQVAGAVGLRAEPAGGGCDRLVVDLAGGGAATVEVPA